MSNLLFMKSAKADDVSTKKIANLIEGISDVQNMSSDASSKAVISNYVFASESFKEEDYRVLSDTMTNFEQNLKEMINNIGLEGYRASQINAAVASSISTSDIRSFINAKIPQPVMKQGFNTERSEYTTVVDNFGVHDAIDQRVGVENFDERDNRNAEILSVAYNLEANRQNDFGNAFFPTVTVSNDNVGVAVSIRLVSVFDDFKRSTEGALAGFNRRNIVRAMLDHTILKNEGTRVIPVYENSNANNNANFDTTVVDKYNYNLEGEIIQTAPLKFNKEIGDIIGLSSTQALIDNGLMNNGDTLDPSIHLDNVYVKLGNDKFKFRLSGLARTGFVAAQEGDSRDQILNFETESLKISRITKQVDGSDMVDFVEVVNQDLTVLLAASITGKVSVSTGRLKVHALDLKVKAIFDQNGNELDLTSGIGQTLANHVTGVDAFGGYDILAYRSNLNRRQRGQLLDTTVYTQIWTVPQRSPLCIPRPVNSTSQTDASDLASLINATFTRMSNEAVTTLIRTAEQLGEYTSGKGNIEEGIAPDLFGVARFLVKPTFISNQINVNAIVNSISSHEKNKDISAVMLSAIRDVAYRMFRDSGYQAMIETGAAGVTGNPTIIIGTDPMTARYLIVDGDTRTLGPDFEFKVVTTSDKRMEGQVAIAFGYPENSDNTLNPVHFGNMLWANEVTLVLPMQRSGGVQKELVVTPRFRHIVNVPVMGWIQVTGIPEVVTSRVPIHFIDKT